MAAQLKVEKLKVFISYSRRDAAAADAFVEALLARGFDVTIDRRDLPFGEKWQAELAEFIRLSDTVVWLVSNASIQSKWVNWELDEVARRYKRLVPVMIAETARDALPRQLGEIHILPAESVFDPQRDLAALVRVLETDRAWLKEASRLQDRAHEWLSKSRPSALLLSRGALSEAERWKDRRPAKAPAPAQEVLDLLLASRKATTRRQRYWIGASTTVAAAALGLAAVAYLQSAEADRQRLAAVLAQKQETRQRRLAEAREEATNQAKLAEEKARRDEAEQRRLADENRAIAFQQEQLAKKNAERAERERDQALISQSRFLAERSAELASLGEVDTAILLALEAVPDKSIGRTRPAVSEAFIALRKAILEKRNLVPLADLRETVSSPITAERSSRLSGQARQKNNRALQYSVKGRVVTIRDAENRSIAELQGHEAEVDQVAISDDGTRALTVTGATYPSVPLEKSYFWVRLWDIRNSKLLDTYRVSHEGLPKGIRFAPNQIGIQINDNEGWLPRHRQKSQRLQLQNERVVHAAISPNRLLAALQLEALTVDLSGRRSVRLLFLDLATGENSFSIRQPQWDCTPRNGDDGCPKAKLEVSNELVAAITGASKVQIFSFSGGQERATIELNGPEVDRIRFNSSGEFLAVSASGGRLSLWSANFGTLVRTVNLAATANDFLVDSSGEHIIVWGHDIVPAVWNVRTGARSTRFYIPPPSENSGEKPQSSMFGFFPIALSGDEKTLLAPINAVQLALWSTETGKLVAGPFDATNTVYSAATSGDGRYLGYTGKQGGAPLIRLDNKMRVADLTKSLHPYYNPTKFDGVNILFGRQLGVVLVQFGGFEIDRVVRLYDLESQLLLAELGANGAVIVAAWFNPNESSVNILTDDGRLIEEPVFDMSTAVTIGKKLARTCLSRAQRAQYFLSPDPPEWCITGAGQELEGDARLWRPFGRYAGPEWKEWLSEKRLGGTPELPNTN